MTIVSLNVQQNQPGNFSQEPRFEGLRGRVELLKKGAVVRTTLTDPVSDGAERGVSDGTLIRVGSSLTSSARKTRMAERDYALNRGLGPRQNWVTRFEFSCLSPGMDPEPSPSKQEAHSRNATTRPVSEPLSDDTLTEFRLVIAHGMFSSLLERLLEQPQKHWCLRAGRARLRDRTCAWLGRALLPGGDALANSGPAAEPLILVRAFSGGSMLPWVESDLGQLPAPVKAELFLGIGVWEGKAWGFARTSGGSRFQALSRLDFPGSGMKKLSLLATPNRGRPMPAGAEVVFSRTVGALAPGQDGKQILCQLFDLKVLLVGAGRTGGLMSAWLAGIGVQIVLVDPDVLELHNLGESSPIVTTGDVGRNKAEALADRLNNRFGTIFGRRVEYLSCSLTSAAAKDAAKESDLIITCCDRDSARLAAAVLASAYLKPHLDVATGIAFSPTADRILGADVRLIVPGAGCLSCFGGLAHRNEAIRSLLLDNENFAQPESAPAWSFERAGSLQSLNLVTAGLGARLLEDLVAGRIINSQWLRLEFEPSGACQIRHPAVVPPAGHCQICAIFGAGDDAF